jgi:hypothetical protein
VEILLLRNYYSSLTYSAIGKNNVIEDVSPELSPRYSRRINGDYVLAPFPQSILNTIYPCDFAYGSRTQSYYRFIGFGNNTKAVTFNDYAPTSLVGDTTITSVRATSNTTYDETSKTYTLVETYTLTNQTSKQLEVNEILLGGRGDSGNEQGYIYITRDLLGDNSFTIGANESVKFELTIKYTIAEPLQ